MRTATLLEQRGESPLGPWELSERRPGDGLSEHVVRITGYHEHFSEHIVRREVPRGTVTFIVSFGDDLSVDLAGTDYATGSFVAGLHDTPALVGSANLRGVQVELTALGAWQLFGVPMRHLANGVVGAGELIGEDGQRLSEQLADERRWAKRIGLVEQFLRHRLADGPPPAPQVAAACRLLAADDGPLSPNHPPTAAAGKAGAAMTVSAVADEVGWTRRRLLDRFGEQVGVSPKAYARLMRFRRALELLDRGVGHPLIDVAVVAGYYDQAHFNRDFRAMAGCTPSEYLAERRAEQGSVRPAPD